MLKEITLLDFEPATIDSLQEVISGLQKSPREIHPKYFYDEVGSQLFDQICELPEYYPTRTEQGIMNTNIDSIIDRIGENALLVEYGSGSSLKTRTLLNHLPDLAGYIPIEISKEHLLATANNLAMDYPYLEIIPVRADYESEFHIPELDKPIGDIVAYFPGSTIGNFHPPRAVEFLRGIRAACGYDSHLLIGVDLQKDKQVLHDAYNDAAGVTAEFNLNMLSNLNQLLDANFNLDQFEHEAFYNDQCHRIEMHLVSKIDQTVTIGDEVISFYAGEKIWTESSYKYTLDSFAALVAQAGYQVVQVWTDPKNFFSVQYLIPKGALA